MIKETWQELPPGDRLTSFLAVCQDIKAVMTSITSSINNNEVSRLPHRFFFTELWIDNAFDNQKPMTYPICPRKASPSNILSLKVVYVNILV